MPINVGGVEQIPTNPEGIYPVGWPYTLTANSWPTIDEEIPNNSPACYPNWDELSPEEQARIAGRYRYMGIRLRSDLKNETVPIRRSTMELP